MKIEKIILFSDSIRTILQKTKNCLIIIKKVFFIMLKWNKQLSVKDFSINNSLLLSNGLLIINWNFNNFLWVKINNKVISINPKGILFHLDNVNTPLHIKVVGLFGKYEKDFTIEAVATIETKRIKIIKDFNFFSIESGLNKRISHFNLNGIKAGIIKNNFNKSFVTNINPIDLHISSFKKTLCIKNI